MKLVTKKERGNSLCGTFLGIILIFGSLFWVLADYLPAESADVQSLVVLAAPSTDAKKMLVDFLKASPNPNRGELRQIKTRIDEILVTETARTVTGDPTLESLTEREARSTKEKKLELARLQATPWAQMTKDEQAVFFWDWFLGRLAIILFSIVLGSMTMIFVVRWVGQMWRNG